MNLAGECVHWSRLLAGPRGPGFRALPGGAQGRRQGRDRAEAEKPLECHQSPRHLISPESVEKRGSETVAGNAAGLARGRELAPHKLDFNRKDRLVGVCAHFCLRKRNAGSVKRVQHSSSSVFSS